jgi:hypothetical protein
VANRDDPLDPRALGGRRPAQRGRSTYASLRAAHRIRAGGYALGREIARYEEHLERLGGAFDPALVFAEHAISGASLNRPAFEAMMAKVKARDREIDVILTEDISRVTRDFADGAMVFRELQDLGVPLIGVSDGIDTSVRGAKLSFAVKNLLADMFLDDLRDKTLRGLEGRALAGCSTGGLPVGYRSEPVHDAASPVEGGTCRGRDGAILNWQKLIFWQRGTLLRALATDPLVRRALRRPKGQ